MDACSKTINKNIYKYYKKERKRITEMKLKQLVFFYSNQKWSQIKYKNNNIDTEYKCMLCLIKIINIY